MNYYHYLPYFIWLLIYFSRDRNSSTPWDGNKPFSYVPKQERHRHIQHISNGRLLDRSLFFYYCDMLNIAERKQIDDETIIRYAGERYALINKIEYDSNWPIATRDVNAAKAYLLDRWNYMMNLN